MSTDRDQWLAQVKEDILEPDLPICDPHHHLWDHPGRRYLIDELIADTGSGHNVTSTVFVECMSMYRADGPGMAVAEVGETEFVGGVAAISRSGRYGPTRVAGIVSFADLTLGEGVGPVLDAHIAASSPLSAASATPPAGTPAIRCATPTRIRRPASTPIDRFRRGFAELARRGLSFDAWLYHPQIPELTSLARAFPDTTIILDHFGGPSASGPTRTGARRSSPSGGARSASWRAAPTWSPSSAVS